MEVAQVTVTTGEVLRGKTRNRIALASRAERSPVSIWLRLTLPIAFLAMTGSVLSLVFQEAIYGRETSDWAAQSVGQDFANLLAFPVLLGAAFFAARGSMRAHLIWIGLLIYSAYTYAIYAFALHFGPLFLVWVAVFGLSVYALIGALVNVDPARFRTNLSEDQGSDLRLDFS
jgi:hypothetical protein